MRHGPARTDEAQQVIDSHIFHDEKTNLAFYVDYAVAQATKLIGRGFRTSKAAVQKLCDAHGVRDPKNHFKRLKQRVVATGLLRRPEREDKGTSIIANDPDIQEDMKKYAVKEKLKFTYEMMSDHLTDVCGHPRGCSERSLSKWIHDKRSGWQIKIEGTKPFIQEQHKVRRKGWSKEKLALGSSRWANTIDVDEKWWWGYLMGCKLKVPPGVPVPRVSLKSKRYIPKVMLLVATALPRGDFNGHVGAWRVAIKHTAKRGSKFHAKGETYLKDATLDSKRYRKMMVEKVYPAARAKMPWAKDEGDGTITIQQDGAGPHTGHDTVKILNEAGAKTRRGTTVAKILVETQPSQSPCTNANDLAVFPSASKRHKHLQKHCAIGDLDLLCRNAMQALDETPPEVRTRAFEIKTLVCRRIVAADGDNDFKLPHRREFSNSDWESLNYHAQAAHQLRPR